MKVNNVEIEWLDKEWIESLLWCPSQIWRRARVGNKVYTLYLRWRWEDPWTFSIIEEDPAGSKTLEWDLFAEKGLFFCDYEYKEAEKMAEKLFIEWVKESLAKSKQK